MWSLDQMLVSTEQPVRHDCDVQCVAGLGGACPSPRCYGDVSMIDRGFGIYDEQLCQAGQTLQTTLASALQLSC